MSLPTPGTTRRAFAASAWRLGAVALVATLAACVEDGAPTSPTPPAPPAQGVMCKDYNYNQFEVKPKTITVHNNLKDETIYPVLSTSKNAENQWVQGCLRTKDAISTNYVYKLYVNEGKGIPPGSSVTITLPLYSDISGSGKDQYITWWNGGRVVLADRGERLRGDPDVKLSTPDDVTCQGQGTDCSLSTYASDVQFPEDIYAQLSEYTFGDSIIPKKDDPRLLKPENVGYNISYVDHVYMPVAIGPKNNPYIGYSGSIQPLSQFRENLMAFLKPEGGQTSPGEGWPVYNLDELKLPGGYNIFAQRAGVLPADDNVPVKPDGVVNPPVLTVLKCIEGNCTEQEKKDLRFGQAVQRMQNIWGACISWGGEDVSKYVDDPGTVCDPELVTNLQAVQDFFKENHRRYLTMYANKQCVGDTPKVPEFNYWEAITHIYGWVPFNEGCGADANALADTSIPGWNHAKIQSMYIHDLQYNHQKTYVINDPKQLFNPYVQLIHDDLKMNAYGFSVDDAVGFMSELGGGLIFAVGGSDGLENPDQFDYANGFSLGIGVPDELDGKINIPLIKKYGVCALTAETQDPDCKADKQDVIMPTNSQIAGFRVGTVPNYPIRVRFTDLNDNVYTVLVAEKFLKCSAGDAVCPPNKTSIVKECSVVDSKGAPHPKSDTWCVGANPNQQQEKQLTKNYLSFPRPVNYL